MAKRRRGRGEGSFENLPSGKWRWVGSQTLGGKREKIFSPSFETKREAQDWRDANRGKTVAVGTLGEWLDKWLVLQESAVAHQTYERDRQVVETHIRKRWASTRLRNLDLLAVRTWLVQLESAKVSASERQRIGSTLRKILNAAVDSQVIATNPIARLKLPTVHRDEKRVLTAAQLAHLVAVA